jgi:hypothetical protein
MMKEKKPAVATTASASSSGSSTTDPNTTPDSDIVAPQPGKPRSVGTIVGALIVAGLASPFLELQGGFSGVIGLVIIFVGMRIAWKMTAAPRLEILGPFQANAPPAAAPSA